MNACFMRRIQSKVVHAYPQTVKFHWLPYDHWVTGTSSADTLVSRTKFWFPVKFHYPWILLINSKILLIFRVNWFFRSTFVTITDLQWTFTSHSIVITEKSVKARRFWVSLCKCWKRKAPLEIRAGVRGHGTMGRPAKTRPSYWKESWYVGHHITALRS